MTESSNDGSIKAIIENYSGQQRETTVKPAQIITNPQGEVVGVQGVQTTKGDVLVDVQKNAPSIGGSSGTSGPRGTAA